jgi:hypothetical protein
VIELVGVEPVNERALYVTQIPSLADWPDTIDEPKPHFAAFVAADSSPASEGELRAFARRLLAQGAVHVSAWGPGCERLHDAFDAESEGSTPPIATTWHADDTLDEALWFALFASFPDEAYVETTDSVLAVVVADPQWAAHVRGRIGNPEALWRSGLARDS